MMSIQEKFEAIAAKNNLSEDEYSLASRVYQSAYQQALADVVEMLGSEGVEREVGACLYTKEGMRQASAKAALTAIKQKVKEM